MLDNICKAMAQAGNGVLTGAGGSHDGLTFGAAARSSELVHTPQDQPLGEDGFEPVRVADLACPVCFETLTDPFVTACGVGA